MTITAVPADPEPEDIRAAIESEFAEREKIPGANAERTPETLVLDAIMCVAVHHDTLCQYFEHRLYAELGFYSDKAAARPDDGTLNDYIWQVVELCATIAPAAIRRIPAPVFAAATANNGAIQSLRGQELTDFLRPIFEESGIGERFEVRTGYQVHQKGQGTN